ncbi:MAG: haloacid dehalogenase-like hydrolase [Desulfuromonadaceae bacterium]|nr:haloacid dehalogenase-like hydrolase [Desulfuromonadaceae bacterium]
MSLHSVELTGLFPGFRPGRGKGGLLVAHTMLDGEMLTDYTPTTGGIMQVQEKVLVSDFDGTMTELDFFRVALSRLPPRAAAPWERYEQGVLSHFDALALIFSRMRVSQQELAAIMVEMRLEIGLAAAVDRLKQAGWPLVIASAGCDYYIERILFRASVNAEIYANPGIFIPGTGLIMKRQPESPFYGAEAGIDKAALVRSYLDRGDDTAFAGDGRPDLAPALLVPPERRFARGWLADELEIRSERFVRFERWRDIAGYLCGGAA